MLPSEENDEGNTEKTRKSKLGISRYISNFQSVFESLYVRREKFVMFSFSEQLNIIKKKINSYNMLIWLLYCQQSICKSHIKEEKNTLPKMLH